MSLLLLADAESLFWHRVIAALLLFTYHSLAHGYTVNVGCTTVVGLEEHPVGSSGWGLGRFVTLEHRKTVSGPQSVFLEKSSASAFTMCHIDYSVSPWLDWQWSPCRLDRDYRATRGQLFDSLEEGGLRSSAPYVSSTEIAEQENERGLEGLHDRVSALKRVWTSQNFDKILGLWFRLVLDVDEQYISFETKSILFMTIKCGLANLSLLSVICRLLVIS